MLEFWAWLSPDSLLFDWRAYWAETRADPSQGTMLYLMLVTTLIPTILHVVAGLGAVVVQRGHWLDRVADELEAAEDPLSVSAINRLTARVRNAQFFRLRRGAGDCDRPGGRALAGGGDGGLDRDLVRRDLTSGASGRSCGPRDWLGW